jgi:hypothetical protein
LLMPVLFSGEYRPMIAVSRGGSGPFYPLLHTPAYICAASFTRFYAALTLLYMPDADNQG